jgi:His-Xaa-Ser system protein HxsD
MPEAVQFRLGDSSIVFVVDEAIYSRGAILRALHWYSDQFGISTSTEPDGTFVITMRSKKQNADFQQLANEFENKLLDAQLRIEIRDETSRIRELIVAKAFAEGDLLDDTPIGDWRDPVAQNKS